MPDVSGATKPQTFLFNGCRICTSLPTKRFRVQPFPATHGYDKAFPFSNSSPEAEWKQVIAFCKKPTLPKGSPKFSVPKSTVLA